VIDSNIIAPLLHLLQHAEFDVKKEAVWAISNATSGGTFNQIEYEKLDDNYLYVLLLISVQLN
jgi:hypothetical protein